MAHRLSDGGIPPSSAYSARFPLGADKPARTLLIQTTILENPFINSPARFWAGAMAGHSMVLIEVRIVEKKRAA